MVAKLHYKVDDIAKVGLPLVDIEVEGDSNGELVGVPIFVFPAQTLKIFNLKFSGCLLFSGRLYRN